MNKKVVFIIGISFFSLILSACSKSEQEPLKISITSWLGYTPLLYMQEKGWLKDINVKLVKAVSLSESMYIYQAGISDAFCGTQYEYFILKKTYPDILPLILFDRSNGGDMIMSNVSIEKLQQGSKKIAVYLEMDSVNLLLLEDFIKKYHIDESLIEYNNRDQVEISALKATSLQPILIVTYIPFNKTLIQNGFKEILSTKSLSDLLVIDALYATKATYLENEQVFKQLKFLVDKSLQVLKDDPKSYYQMIKPHLDNMNYADFIASLNDIVWLNQALNDELKRRMRQASLPIKDLL